MKDATHPCREPHRLAMADQSRNAGRTRLVLILTVIMMAAEIAAGSIFGSMALLADGWHMSTHAAVLAVAVFAYSYARRHAANAAYTFGTGKVGDLAAFTSAILLGVVALIMAYESAERLANPVNIAFSEAIVVAVIGLIVNLVSAWLLKDDHPHAHDHSPDHGHDHEEHAHEEHAHHHAEHHAHKRDHNREAAYAHVLADALTSVFAIVALTAGLFWGLNWMDPAMGVVGAAVIARWSWLLMKSSGRVLLDATPTAATERAVRKAIESDGDVEIADLHVWRIAPGQLAAVLTVVTRTPKPAAYYKARLAGITGLSHTTVEVEAA
ncbi:MAG: CDF family Co(II)/Ni(II) efflux transporter DmeF [Rhodospirillaceae bacterium]